MNRFCIICTAFVSVACAAAPAPLPFPDTIPPTAVVDAPRIVQRACPDSRPVDKRTENVDFPTDPEDIAAVPEGDFERLSTLYKAAIDMARALLDVAETQIKGCAAEP